MTAAVGAAVAYVIMGLVAIYTWNYAAWAWRRGLVRGAVGLALLGLAAIAVPAWVLGRGP